ncbi:hypothetical protein [Alicyclobacillus sp. ALC3]|uniref:hypothetical protein n=1 Tax=Alicyclobacillus sp. ALC3 TaxID=2796143 RepID=UPI00237886C4|nr:hypothetical protein [Alicyclobacillus sp. ALC3]WDL97236.1 hypothetical protein JC200_00270 [Alicyclobacillus sp. ALC3]
MLWTAAVAFFLVIVALVVAAWDNVSSEWNVEQAAAQFALNHSPIEKISSHQVFTANQAQEVFYGTDAFGHKWYAFVYGDPFVVHAVPATGLLTKQQADAVASKSGDKPLSTHIGYLDTAAAQTFHTSVGAVWEVYAQLPNGTDVYLYFRANNGKAV